MMVLLVKVMLEDYLFQRLYNAADDDAVDDNTADDDDDGGG